MGDQIIHVKDGGFSLLPRQPTPAALESTGPDLHLLIQHGEHTKSPAALAHAPVPTPSLAAPAAYLPLPYPPPLSPSQPPTLFWGERGKGGTYVVFPEEGTSGLKVNRVFALKV